MDLMNMNPILIGLGCYLNVDGIVSIVVYRKQTIPEHLVRIARCGAGIAIIVMGILI